MAKKAAKRAPKKSTGRNLNDFAETFDVRVSAPKQIQAALDDLGDGWLKERDLSRKYKLSLNQLNEYRERFADYVVKTSGTSRAVHVWCGSKAFAAKCRAQLQ